MRNNGFIVPRNCQKKDTSSPGIKWTANKEKNTKGHALNTCLLWPTCQMTFESTFVLDKIQKIVGSGQT